MTKIDEKGVNFDINRWDDKEKEKWYKRIYKKILKWFKPKSQFNSRPKKYYNVEENYNSSNNNYNYNTNNNSNNNNNISAEDIPRMSLNPENGDDDNKQKDTPANITYINKNTISNKAITKELSPMINEPWKEDAQLMLLGTYSRFKMMTSFIRKYRLISIIGQGSFGFVLKGERFRDGREVAVKFIYKSNINVENWIFDCELGLIPTEVFHLKSLNHRGIVQFLDYFEEDRYVYLVTELHGISWGGLGRNSNLNEKSYPGLKMNNSSNSGHNTHPSLNLSASASPCDLFECIEAHYYLPESTIHLIFTQLLDISAYLSSQGLVHRDLKDENVVVDAEYMIKIVDFGCSSRIPYTNTNNGDGTTEGYFEKFNGTLAFAPPEVIRGLKYRGSEAETWTLGVLLYTMAFRQAPFQDSQAILYGQLDFPFDEERPGILDLIRKLLCKNPLHRIKLNEIHKHPWVIRGPEKSTALNRSAENVLKSCGVNL